MQAFQKLPPLAELAPTQSEPPFLIAQLVVMAIFVVLGRGGEAVSRHPEQADMDAPALDTPLMQRE